jgi:hypothetical protein
MRAGRWPRSAHNARWVCGYRGFCAVEGHCLWIDPARQPDQAPQDPASARDDRNEGLLTSLSD